MLTADTVSSLVEEQPDRAGRERVRLLYLAQFDPLSVHNGTSTRGRLFLSRLASDFDTTLVYVQSRFERREDVDLAGRLIARYGVPFSRSGHFFFDRQLYRQAVRAIQEHPPDVILADSDKAGLYAWLLSRRFRIPFVYSSHNVEYQRYMSLSRTDRLRLLFVPAVYLVERLSVAKAAATISITSADARVYRGWTRDDRVVTLPCAFDETVFNPHQVDDGETASPIVLIVGNYRYPPNRHAAYRLMETVIPEVCRQLPEVRFRFVGRDFPADIQHPCVEAAGFVTDLAGEYRRAVVVLVPIESGGGLPIKAVEALACGRSVVLTPKGIEGVVSSLLGMEGIDHVRLDLVQVGPLEDFAAMILHAIATGPRTTTKNWDLIRRTFGSATQLQELSQILRRIAGHNGGNSPATV